jgi:hypothetical protein
MENSMAKFQITMENSLSMDNKSPSSPSKYMIEKKIFSNLMIILFSLEKNHQKFHGVNLVCFSFLILNDE